MISTIRAKASLYILRQVNLRYSALKAS